MPKMPKLALIVATAFVLAACGSSDDGGSDGATGATAPTGDRPSSTAKLSIVAPKVGEVVHGSSVDLRVKLQGAKLVPATTTHIVPDEGHLHVILDDTLISMTEGLEQTIPDVPPGRTPDHGRVRRERSRAVRPARGLGRRVRGEAVSARVERATRGAAPGARGGDDRRPRRRRGARRCGRSSRRATANAHRVVRGVVPDDRAGLDRGPARARPGPHVAGSRAAAGVRGRRRGGERLGLPGPAPVERGRPPALGAGGGGRGGAVPPPRVRPARTVRGGRRDRGLGAAVRARARAGVRARPRSPSTWGPGCSSGGSGGPRGRGPSRPRRTRSPTRWWCSDEARRGARARAGDARRRLVHVLLARADPDRRGVPALGRPGARGRRRVRRCAARRPARERRRRRGRPPDRARPRRHPERRRRARRDRPAPRRRRPPGVRELREHDLGAGRRGVRAPGHAVLGDRRGGRDDRPRRRRARVPRRALGRDPGPERDRVRRGRVRAGARRRPVEAPVRGHARGRRVRARGGAGRARRARGARPPPGREVRLRPAGREHARVRPRPGRRAGRTSCSSPRTCTTRS